ncbi:3-hydroxyacyl-CoA dehydrogenase PaaC [Enterobacteriaceae bacterium 4M9]|nr:3-hydroxyacyl-CoA dehydrogenase PaaC [Enterobacteriaceae bacterium 4M9]
MTIGENDVIAVVGSGAMGSGIAQVAAAAGHPVRLYDISPDATRLALQKTDAALQKRVQKGKLSDEQRKAIMSRLMLADTLTDLAGARLVIEAVAEKLDIKQQLLCELAQICGEQTLLVSNTSSISITAIASVVPQPQRVAGFHFFNPAPVMKLVEVVSGLETSHATVSALCALAERWGKTAVRCGATPGFIVNRVARPYYAEAWRALEENIAPPEVIDSALRDAGGFPMGPLELTDLIGQDVNFAVTCSVFNAFWQERRFLPSLVQQELVLGKRLGQKSGRGVYRWPRESAASGFMPPEPRSGAALNVTRTGESEWLDALAKQVTKSDAVTKEAFLELDDVVLAVTCGESAGAMAQRLKRPVVLLDLALDYGRTPVLVISAAASNTREQTAKAVHWLQQQDKQVLMIADYPGLLVWRTVAMLVNEALDAEQKQVASAQDIDTAMRLGVNYPRGPLAWGQSLGWWRVLQMLENLQRHYGEERYRPCSRLRQRALEESHDE